MDGDSADVVLDIVDATNLERNLYLTLQLLERGKKVVIALNMMDELRRRGIAADAEQLSRALGAPVVPISAKKGEGLDALMKAVATCARAGAPSDITARYDPAVKRAIARAGGGQNGGSRAKAVMAIAGDIDASGDARAAIRELERERGMDALTALAKARYDASWTR